MSWMERETSAAEREWRTAPSRRAFPLQGQWWEVTTNGEFVGVRATLGSARELRQLIGALQAYIPYFEEREDKPQSGDTAGGAADSADNILIRCAVCGCGPYDTISMIDGVCKECSEKFERKCDGCGAYLSPPSMPCPRCNDAPNTPQV